MQKKALLTPSSSSSTILSAYAHVACSSLLHRSLASVWHVLFIGIKLRAKITWLLTRMPLWEKPTELQTTEATNVHLLFQNPAFHTHFSITIVVSQIQRAFWKKRHASFCENEHTTEIELSGRAPKFRSLNDSITSQSTQLPFSHRWLSIAEAPTTGKSWNENLSEPSPVSSSLANTPTVSEKSQLVPSSPEAIFFPFAWTKSFYICDSL